MYSKQDQVYLKHYSLSSIKYEYEYMIKNINPKQYLLDLCLNHYISRRLENYVLKP